MTYRRKKFLCNDRVPSPCLRTVTEKTHLRQRLPVPGARPAGLRGAEAASRAPTAPDGEGLFPLRRRRAQGPASRLLTDGMHLQDAWFSWRRVQHASSLVLRPQCSGGFRITHRVAPTANGSQQLLVPADALQRDGRSRRVGFDPTMRPERSMRDRSANEKAGALISWCGPGYWCRRP
jgi:hypothetical protein